MTWENWVASSYNTNDFKIGFVSSIGGVVGYQHNASYNTDFKTILNGVGYASQIDVIVNSNDYTTTRVPLSAVTF